MKTKVMVLLLGIVLLTGLAYVLFGSSRTNVEPRAPEGGELTAGSVTITGLITCLPHRDTEGPQTMECALGLQDQEGHYYALRDTDPNYRNISSAPSNTMVTVDGIFTPREDRRYQGVGIIDVTSIMPVTAPERATLQGVYLCLPHIATFGPQTDECRTGLKTDDGKYYALDFGLMSAGIPPHIATGDRISAQGIITPAEELSAAFWQQYPIEAVFSVTDSFEKI